MIVHKVYHTQKAWLYKGSQIIFDRNDNELTLDNNEDNFKEVDVILCSNDIYKWHDELENMRMK